MNNRPLLERNFIFQIIIACDTEDQARSLHPNLTNILISLGLPDAHNDPLVFATRIFNSPEFNQLDIQSHSKWYPLFRTEIPVTRNIYMRHQWVLSWESLYTNLALYSRELSEAINDSTYSKFRRYNLLKSCLIFMVLSGDEGKMMESGFLPAGDKTQSENLRD